MVTNPTDTNAMSATDRLPPWLHLVATCGLLAYLVSRLPRTTGKDGATFQGYYIPPPTIRSQSKRRHASLEHVYQIIWEEKGVRLKDVF